MRIRNSHMATLLVAGAAVLAVAVAPTASAVAATPGMSCAATGGGTECQAPGDVQINDSPPPIGFDPYGDYGLLLGGFGPGGFHGGGFRGGGFHGGGFHGGGGHR